MPADTSFTRSFSVREDRGRAGLEVNPSPCSSSHRLHRFFLPSAATLHLISDTGAATLLCRRISSSKKNHFKKVSFGETLYAVVKTLPLLTSSQRSLSWCHFLSLFYFGSSTHILLPLCWFFLVYSTVSLCSHACCPSEEKKSASWQSLLRCEQKRTGGIPV